VGPFEILKRIGLVAYRLRLPEELNSVHETFYVSNLKKYLADANLHVPLDEIKVDKTLCFIEEPIEIMDPKIKKLKCRKIVLVKVRWNSKRGLKFTWGHEDQMRIKMATPSCNDLVFEVNNDGVTGDGMAGVDVGGAEDVVSDDGVDVVGGEEANLDEEVRVRKVLDKGKRIMIEEDNLKRKRKSRPRGNGIVIEENDNPSLMDESESKTDCDFGTHIPNHIDVGLDYNMHSDSESDYS
ncbi:hypothetical protein Tco_0897707, partial [Tanacetum coccineum]